MYQSRLLNFFGTFANEAGNEDRVAFVEAVLGPLVELSFAKDPTARWRFCQLLHAVVGNLPPDAELSDELVEAFEEAMLERLDDAKPTVRAVALRALARLPDPGSAGDFSACELTRAMLDMLAAEKSRVVRKAVLATLPCSDFTRKFFMERTRDEADDVSGCRRRQMRQFSCMPCLFALCLSLGRRDAWAEAGRRQCFAACPSQLAASWECRSHLCLHSAASVIASQTRYSAWLSMFLRCPPLPPALSMQVRKMAYMAIAERVPLSAMPAADATLLLRRGLTDRAGSVRDAVASKLLQGWLEEHEGEPLQLIHALGVQAHPGEEAWQWLPWALLHPTLRAVQVLAALPVANIQLPHVVHQCGCDLAPSLAEECELVLKTLLERGDMNAVHLARMAESDGMGLRADFSDPVVLMGPASALLWRVVCEWLSTQAASKGLSAAGKVGAAAHIDAAAAAERLEALEAALPATVADMAAIISKHAAAGAAYRFSTGQLMQLAAKCQDFADASGRAAASAMLEVLLTNAHR